MTPDQINQLAPLIGFLVSAFIVSIPVIAFSARFAIRPIADAMVRMREAQGRTQGDHDALLMQERRMNLLEAELQQVHGTLERLMEADRFRNELEAGSRAAPAALRASNAD